ncbi:MAG: hypothetical protein HY689_00385 [Chloroflexi bacterium]|nr:hypothetical protein [Chloroflexota bacterium]
MMESGEHCSHPPPRLALLRDEGFPRPWSRAAGVTGAALTYPPTAYGGPS